MSELQPEGINVKVKGEVHSFLFSLRLIEIIQYKTGKRTGKTVGNIMNPESGALRFVLTELLNDEQFRNGGERRYSETDAGEMILSCDLEDLAQLIIAITRAYDVSMPDPDEDIEEKSTEELLDIPKFIMLGMVKMHYTEEELLKMTPRKFFLMFDRYLEIQGLKKEEVAPIDLLP